MRPETAGITRANEGLDGVTWNILGQTYVPKSLTEHSFSWHATFPPGTFVPPHVHPTQDEYLYILEGRLDFVLGGEETAATPGDLVRLPKGEPHGIFNKSGAVAKCLFWVAPTGKLPDLFRGIHAMTEQKPEEVVALSARHDVEFLPPPGA
jgi:quercetin dioxygenase-like cupin family protein